ncbi:hypothetical protein AAZX31_13G353500 [Glycine max]|uniref:RING-CH-type domain-containing protein n=1 Tax=Glycine max TaxID=3847 RepID=A0A0R0GZA9_SOYBN|nr:uncharacterized protein LOC100808123 isoform X1 [Glycine max]KAH1105370.1 hypothetical protein GYH30_038567 [Glycine max]KAH1219609.1 E3 ubiquitin-protein ligase MARCH2 [Glycine max]KRH23709.1 hypothetical protein GLYMA_13G372600v4 [Glycine max]|eukprot:XP_006593458.1 uncharacterized protein LOC100808123 isoform X1 [Glycine max]
MQLASNGDKEECSESEPILNHHHLHLQPTGESSFSCEIIPIPPAAATFNDDDLQNVRVDETCHLVNADQPQCRICLDIGGEDLIAPCHCKGTQKYVHRSCLDNWRSTKEGFAFSHCTECRAVFILRANVPPDRWWLRLKFQFLVARDHAFIFIIVQLVVAFLGVLVYKFYGDELREMFGYEEHPYGFYTMAGIYPWLPRKKIHGQFLAIVLVGLLYGFFIAIICGQRINERHYHVLAKQELTKEYVVEDREHVKNVPELDPSHVTELRMLGLY